MKCNNYAKIMQKIQDAQKNCPQCYYCAGPTGPQGEVGPTGPANVSDTITIRNTITAEAGTPATVTDTTGSPNHVLDFAIPQGVTGPQGATGPTGPTGSMSSNCYGMAHTTLNQTVGINEYVPFNVNDRISNMTIGQNGTIVLPLEGSYLVNWWIALSNPTINPVVLNFELQEILPVARTLGWSTSGKEVENDQTTVISGTAIVDSGYDETVRSFALVNKTGVDVFLNPNVEIGTVITIVKIN